MVFQLGLNAIQTLIDSVEPPRHLAEAIVKSPAHLVKALVLPPADRDEADQDRQRNLHERQIDNIGYSRIHYHILTQRGSPGTAHHLNRSVRS